MRGEGLDRVEILTSLLAILSNIPEFSRFAGQLGKKEGKEKGEAGWLKNLLLAIFTDQDNAALEFYVALMQTDDQEYMRDFLRRLKARDDGDKGKRIGSFAMNLFLRKNTTETIDEITQPAPAQAPAGKKGKPGSTAPAPSTVKKTVRSPREDTPDDIRVKYLESVVERIKAKESATGRQAAGFAGTTTVSLATQTITRDAAIDAVINEMEASGFISTESFEKRLAEFMVILEEANVSLLYTMLEARLVLAAEEYERIMQVVKAKTENKHTGVPDKLPENASKQEEKKFQDCKDYYEEELSVLLTAAMDVKVNSNKPQGLWRQPLQEYVDGMRSKSKDDPKIRHAIAIAIVGSIAGPKNEKSPSEEILQQHGICIVPQKISSERLPLKWLLIAIAVLGLFLWLMGGLPTQ